MPGCFCQVTVALRRSWSRATGYVFEGGGRVSGGVAEDAEFGDGKVRRGDVQASEADVATLNGVGQLHVVVGGVELVVAAVLEGLPCLAVEGGFDDVLLIQAGRAAIEIGFVVVVVELEGADGSDFFEVDPQPLSGAVIVGEPRRSLPAHR